MILPVDFSSVKTPCYFYDMDLLSATLDEIERCSGRSRRFSVHYALKANSERQIVEEIAKRGFGADCVSIGEVLHAISCGVPASKIVYAGVGKTDSEIEQAIRLGIACFNIESLEEIAIIDEITSKLGCRPNVALRINPDIDAHTHHYITTGLAENKFGIDMRLLDRAVEMTLGSKSVNLIGFHFHIGSQILTMVPFQLLSVRVNSLLDDVERKFKFKPTYVNIGGGLGIDYDDPDKTPIADFEGFFSTFEREFSSRPDLTIHCELGRSVVAQCGTLLTRVLYVKEGLEKKFAIVDAGMNNLIRPALYQAVHKIENLTSRSQENVRYDVVGPICESSDTFGENLLLAETRRGDMLAVRSAGAYGQSMASAYNMRPEASRIFFSQYQ